MGGEQRIGYVPLDSLDEAMRAELDRCSREGTPRPESSAIRAHVPAVFWGFARYWQAIFVEGVCDHAIKELCRSYVARSIDCDYCGSQQSVRATAEGLTRAHVDELLTFETSDRFDERQRAALAYARAITWQLPTDDAFWARVHRHFSEPELVELGCFVGLTLGQQSWLRMLNIQHLQVLADRTASLPADYVTAHRAAKEDPWPLSS